MDTKWKKFRNNTAVKVVAFLLACVFGFMTAYSAVYVLAFSDNYLNGVSPEELFIENENTSITNSQEFRNNITSDTELLNRMVTEYISDENVENGNAFARVEETLKKETEEKIVQNIIQEKKRVIDNAIYYESYSEEDTKVEYRFNEGDVDKQQTTVANRTQDFQNEEIVTINNVKYYRGFPLDAVIVDEAKIRSDAEKEYQHKINSQGLTYKSEYKKNKEKIESLVNLKFAIKNKQTGEIYTNMGNEINLETSFIEMINKDTWSVVFENGIFESSNNVYNENYYSYVDDELIGNITNTFDSKIFDVYIALNPSASFEKGDAYYDMQQEYNERLEKAEPMRTNFIVFFVLTVLTLVLLGMSAGKLDEEGKTKKAKIDKIYNDLHFIISGGLAVGGIALLAVTYSEFFSYEQYSSNYKLGVALCALIGSAVVAVFSEWLMSVVRSVRTSTYWKHTFIYVLFVKNAKRLGKGFKKLWNFLKEVFTFQKTKNLRTRMIKIVCCYAGANVLLAFLMGSFMSSYHGVLAFLMGLIMIAINISLIVTAKSTIKALDDMMEALIQAENGKFDFDLNIYQMPMYLRDFATHILNLREGIKIAVDEAVKGERMKAELITNVSHDLKTPLTSIVSYVDLLKRCEIEDEAAKSYITILEEKSERLKKLIEDLVEASKVSTGNIQMNITKVNLNELAGQLAGENEEELQKLGIELRVTTPENPPIVKADSQKAYRAIENLFSNVRKYAMPGTRVYVDVGTEDSFGYFSIKNISKDELNVSAEQLMQRFVRGDSARTSEGSGLGLSIADNLVKLQDGEFNIELDGDLFKATIKFPIDK